MPLAFMRQHRVVPLSLQDDTLTVGMADPTNQSLLTSFTRQFGDLHIVAVALTPQEIDRALAEFPSGSRPESVGRSSLESLVNRFKRLAQATTLPATKAMVDDVSNHGPGNRAATEALSTRSPLGVATDLVDLPVLESAAPQAAIALQEPTVEAAPATMAPIEQLRDLVADLELQQDVELVPETSTFRLESSANETPVVRLASNIMAHAISRRVSDIHLEPREHELALRFRIDGVMHLEQLLPKRVQLALTSRFKIIANLDISERRLPQDGRISLRLDGKPIDIRISTMPTKYGEKLCMRILDKGSATLDLTKLIRHPQVLASVQEITAQPYGIVFVTGPTGSGKTTTLYSALAALNTPDVAIATVEDPIEYELPGINQVQIQKEIGLDFARVLRGFLRQDPDILLVGETRDRETAKTAVEAALTGHMVFTSLHTNSAAGSFMRLQELGVEPFLTASATIGIIAQRLVRRICQACREPYQPDEGLLNYLGWPYDAPTHFYKGSGCDVCDGTGYKGRVGIYEVLRLNGELRKLIVAGASTHDIHAKAVEQGMLDLKAYAQFLIQSGETTVEEVLTAVAVSD